ncbi:MAG: hypothetical protein U1E67_16255 [Hyphomicrobiales bacterium]
MKLTNVHLAVSAFAAAAGVVFAAIQTFGTSNTPPPPVTVTLAVDPAKAAQPDNANQTVAKSQDQDAINTALKADGGVLQPVAASTGGGKLIDLANTGRFSSALKDDSASRYSFRDMFDGRPDTSVTIDPPDSDLNVLVEFGSQTAVAISEIDYTPPPVVPGISGATVLDVMVLPESGAVGANGGQVLSYVLQTEPGRQSFSLPPDSRGKGLWLRIGGAGSGKLAVGDFRVYTP